eukprot:CAMPEP_0198325730 /NCGR_PEP_ID=MMETSP1450-20131203/13408_1 /TAXON_ID=753684 ORGANISM="Madagascaria erythrocladiodes, Strain CCMP3234" /NCGR_SAMPLE_ID=MMETSP1450 /ASSEMBLY_ACC=CAM_ASM_001115 /LENGTH=140 /DNA_ID=CAMNT_0044029645 /DNA_START=191 /DNA_END=613 /DNA_ORIENTATION=+
MTSTKPMLGPCPNLAVRSVEKSAEWYAKLGFSLADKMPPKGSPLVWAQLKSQDGVCIMVQEWNSFSEEFPHLKAHGSKDGPGGTFGFYFQVPDVVSVHQNMVQKGITPVKPLHKQEYGMQEFTVQDPDGYTIVFGSECEK